MVSLNVNGLSTNTKKRLFAHQILYPPMGQSPDVFCIQEVHSTVESEQDFLNVFQYDLAFTHGRSLRTGGLVIGLKRNLDYNVLQHYGYLDEDSNSSYLMLHANIQGEEVVIINVYTANGASPQKKRFWNKLAEDMTMFGCPNIIMCGDFNTVLDLKKDATYYADRDKHSTAAFNEFIDSCELIDTFRTFNPMSRRVTRFDARASGARLDYFFISGYFSNSIQQAEILSHKTISDHNPVRISLCIHRNPKGPGYWRFPDPVLDNEQFVTTMQTKLKTHIDKYARQVGPESIWDLLKYKVIHDTKEFLRLDGLADKCRNEFYQETLADLHHRHDNAVRDSKRRHLNSEIVEVTQAWDVFLARVGKKRLELNIGRARKEREKSSKYFFRKFNAIPGSSKMLYDHQDRECSSDSEILNVCHNFYSKLYCKPIVQGDPVYTFIPVSQDPEIVNQEERDDLARTISLEELMAALKGMKKGKAPGVDGISVAFLQTFWDILGPHVLASFEYAWVQKKLVPSQRKGIIKLLPKRDKNPNFVQNLRPISLLNNDLKILTRALAVRLKAVLDKVLHPDQNLFIKGRYIGNAVLDFYAAASKALDDDEDFLLMNLDIEKAFDSVSWKFLYKTLTGFGIPEDFISWIKILHNGKELQVYNNGYASKSIFVKNGLAQGCVLSPLLFIFCIETLGNVVRDNKVVEGIKVGDLEKKVNMAADDTAFII